ncbi:hypothetical protein TruAng_003479 [Truncatella angustata]|nr:hypothetical protein TruAng_003479 [Truncatella angustata]
MTEPAGAGASFASPMDWFAQRATITHLYQDKNMTLSELKKYMRAHHGFNATIKMYKYRLGQWNIRKNLRYSEVEKYANSGAECSDGDNIPRLRGKKASQRRINAYIKRRCELVPTGSPKKDLIFWGDTKALERCIHATRCYVLGNLGTARWSTVAIDPMSINVGRQWHQRMWSAASLLNMGQVDPAFRLLRDCNKKIEDLLILDEPTFFEFASLSILRLCTSWPDLALSVVGHMYSLSKVIFQSSQHPAVIFLSSLYKLGRLGSHQVALAFLVLMKIEVTVYLVAGGAIDTVSGIATLQKILSDLQASAEQRYVDILMIKSHISWMHFQNGDYDTVSSLNAEILSVIDDDVTGLGTPRVITCMISSDGQKVDPIAQGYMMLFLIEQKHGEVEVARAVGKSLIEHCLETYGREDERMNRSLTLYEEYLKKVWNNHLATSVLELSDDDKLNFRTI